MIRGCQIKEIKMVERWYQKEDERRQRKENWQGEKVKCKRCEESDKKST